jgi:hypothetical protein
MCAVQQTVPESQARVHEDAAGVGTETKMLEVDGKLPIAVLIGLATGMV